GLLARFLAISQRQIECRPSHEKPNRVNHAENDVSDARGADPLGRNQPKAQGVEPSEGFGGNWRHNRNSYCPIMEGLSRQASDYKVDQIAKTATNGHEGNAHQ